MEGDANKLDELKNKTICVNAANLHFGGGIQVATSFLRELIDLKHLVEHLNISIFVSSKVVESLGKDFINLRGNYDVQEVNIYGLQAIRPSVRRLFLKFDVVFTIFGPDYLLGIKAKRIVGFAQPRIIYDKNLSDARYNRLQRIRVRLKFLIQKFFFKNADAYVVELEHVKDEMLKKGIGNNANIHIAYNTVSQVYIDNKVDINGGDIKDISRPFRLGVISRNYPHKNLSIFPEVKDVLERGFGKTVEFYVTFEEDEFRSESLLFQESVINLGYKTVNECLNTYLLFDAVFFPTLLECFSATPLEAMAVGRALFASDMPFNRDICGEHAYYFDPLDPEDAARVISNYIDNKWGRDSLERIAAQEHALSFSNPRDRALKYIEVINNVLSSDQ